MKKESKNSKDLTIVEKYEIELVDTDLFYKEPKKHMKNLEPG